MFYCVEPVARCLCAVRGTPCFVHILYGLTTARDTEVGGAVSPGDSRRPCRTTARVCRLLVQHVGCSVSPGAGWMEQVEILFPSEVPQMLFNCLAIRGQTSAPSCACSASAPVVRSRSVPEFGVSKSVSFWCHKLTMPVRSSVVGGRAVSKKKAALCQRGTSRPHIRSVGHCCEDVLPLAIRNHTVLQLARIPR
jgi:hypothetical protein